MISETQGVPLVQEIQNSLPITDIQSDLEKAKQEPNYTSKRKIYESAFLGLHTQGYSYETMRKQLHTLFESYAMDTCYGQESADGLDEEMGYRQSAALLELDFLLQLHELGLTHFQPEWTSNSLADLINELGFERFQNSKYFNACKDALKIDPKTLAEKEPSLLLAKTLIGLSYSTQNISHLQTASDFHKKINALTEAAINGETQEELELLEDYRYNRAEFIVEQTNPNDVEALKSCYEPVLELTNKVYAKQPLKLASRIAQIKNMNGLLLHRNGLTSAAEPYFQEAFDIRKELLGKFDTDKENFDQRFLLCNLRSALVVCCLVRSDIHKAVEHAKELQLFLNELKERDNANSYSNNYELIISRVNGAKLLLLGSADKI